ncbi:hypothetical protein, partial [Bilophila wadsworthia]|uniref:hypothetical protein n=1 Tax=Bilophila wadsworthia TaxID=35833 RepID=UPI0028EDB053
IGEGREELSVESSSLPSPNPSSPISKTFGLIESLLLVFPVVGGEEETVCSFGFYHVKKARERSFPCLLSF